MPKATPRTPAPPRTDGRPRRSFDEPALESRPRAHTARPAHLVHLQHRRALDRHERGDHHLHARLGPDAAGHDVVAGADHDPAGQHRRARADDPQRARRHEVRRVVSRAVPGQLRRQRRQRPGHAARDRRVRVVRHPDVDWRAGARHAAARGLAGLVRRCPAACGSRLARSGRSRSASSCAGSKASGCCKAGRRRCCWAAGWRCCCGPSTPAAAWAASSASPRGCSRDTRRSGRCFPPRSPPTSATGRR